MLKENFIVGQQYFGVIVEIKMEILGYISCGIEENRMDWKSKGMFTHKVIAGGHKVIARDHKVIAGGHKVIAGGHKVIAGGHKVIARGHKVIAGRRLRMVFS